MGISSKKSSTTSTSHTVETPNVPQWGVDSLKDYNTQVQKIANTDPSTFATGPSALQTQAFTGAANLGGWKDTSNQATALANQVGAAGANTVGPAAQAQAAGIFDNGIAKYLNPELQNVVDTSLADFDQNAGETRAQQAAKGALAGAFGGSRWGLQEGETEGQLARARGSLDSGLRSNAYDTATGLANDDAGRSQAANLANAAATNQTAQFNASQKDAALNRQQGVAGLLGNLASAFDTNQRADVDSQAQQGDTQRGIAQAKATAPISLAQTVGELLGQNQLPLLTGQTVDSNSKSTTKQSPSLLSSVGQAVTTAAKLAALFA